MDNHSKISQSKKRYKKTIFVFYLWKSLSIYLQPIQFINNYLLFTTFQELALYLDDSVYHPSCITIILQFQYYLLWKWRLCHSAVWINQCLNNINWVSAVSRSKFGGEKTVLRKIPLAVCLIYPDVSIFFEAYCKALWYMTSCRWWLMMLMYQMGCVDVVSE